MRGDDALTAALTVHPPPAHAMPELESAIADVEAANDDVVGTREMRAAEKKKAQEAALGGVTDGDVAGTGEEDFEDGMRQNAMERDAADADNDGKLDFGEFCQFVRDREEGEAAS